MPSNPTAQVKHKKFAFVMPTFNYAAYITRAIDSMVQQEGDDYQIIIMDDGSTDETKEILKHKFSHIPYLHIYYQDNEGPNVACAEAIKKSNADYIIFMAADDAISPVYLKKIRAILDNEPDLEMIFGNARSISEKGKTRVSVEILPSSVPKECFRMFLMGEVSIPTCGTLLKKDVMTPYINYPRPYPHNYDTAILAHALLKNNWHQSQDIFVDVYSHSGRFRDSALPTCSGNNIVDIVFDKNLLGHAEGLGGLKIDFLAKYHVSNMRSFYRAKIWHEALNSFKLAFNTKPSSIFSATTLKRFVICFIRTQMGRSLQS